MVHRGIATLAAAVMLCFFMLSHLDTQFFLLHLYQSLIYLAVILMLFYFEDHYAYMIGMLAPAVWLILAFAIGVFGGGMRQLALLLRAQRATNEVSLVAGVTAVLCALMIVFCGYRWNREYAGLGKGRTTFLVSLGILIVYYGILVAWFWRMIPLPAIPG